MLPEKQFGVVVLANRSGASLPRTVQKAMELVLALPAPSTTSGDTVPLPPLTAQQRAAYVGVYSQGARTMEVVARADTLVLKQGSRETELRRTGAHRFAPNVFFVAGTDGRIDYLHSGGRSWKKVQ